MNSLEKLPDAITSLIGLEELYLNDTFIEYLPANFGRLVNLRILELRDNNLVTLPKSISRLLQLRRIDIGNNEFKELPEVIGNLVNLTELWCDGNRIRRITCNLANLKQMYHFEASNNLLQFLPGDIGNWQKCEELSVSSNELEELPFSIGLMKSLVTLKLDENQLQELPESICQLENLEEIMVSHNDLFKLPSSIGLLRRLRFLTADENLLRFLPNEICSCANLTILSVRGNKLTKIPPDLGRLTQLVVLNFVNNFLKNLPVTILNLRRLSALWISDNQSQPLMPLQKEFDESSQSYHLTCYLLPQVIAITEPSHTENNNLSAMQYDGTPANVSVASVAAAAAAAATSGKRRICFASDPVQEVMTIEATSRLMRSPTPYPKELRIMSKFAAKNSNGPNTKTTASKMLGTSMELNEHLNHTGDMSSTYDDSFAITAMPNGIQQRSGNVPPYIDDYHELTLKAKALEIKEARITATNLESPLQQVPVNGAHMHTTLDNGNFTVQTTPLLDEPDYGTHHPYAQYAHDTQPIDNTYGTTMVAAGAHPIGLGPAPALNGYEHLNHDDSNMMPNDNHKYVSEPPYQYTHASFDHYHQKSGHNGHTTPIIENNYYKTPLIYEQIEQPYQIASAKSAIYYNAMNGVHQTLPPPPSSNLNQSQHQRHMPNNQDICNDADDSHTNNSGQISSQESLSTILSSGTSSQQQQQPQQFPPPYHIARALTKKSKHDLLTYDMVRTNGQQPTDKHHSCDDSSSQSTSTPLSASTPTTENFHNHNDLNKNYSNETGGLIQSINMPTDNNAPGAKSKTTPVPSTPWLFGLHKTPTVVINIFHSFFLFVFFLII